MDWFTNMFTPVTERTDISPIVNTYYQRVMRYAYTQPLYNFTGGSPYNNGWNYFQNNNWGGSIFGYGINSGNSAYYNGYSRSRDVYNFTGTGTLEVQRTTAPTAQKRTNSSVPKAAKQSPAQSFGKAIVQNAEKYLGYNETDGSFRQFTSSTEWCADFVSYVVKETYRNQGKAVPAGFGYRKGPELRCEELKQWAIDNNKFLFTAGKADKREIIRTQVKPGDIVIMREKVGNEMASHTGIVRYVDKETGNYQTIEGNVTTGKGVDSVVRMNHKYNDPEVTGFIQLA